MRRGPCLLPAMALGLALGAHADSPTWNDIPAGHWAREALREVAAAGFLVDAASPTEFRGDRPLSRYEMAREVERLLNLVTPGALPPAARTDLEALTREFAPELEALGARVDALEETTARTRAEIDALKAGGGARPPTAGSFSGLLAVGLVHTDDGRPPGVPAAGATPGRTRYGGLPDQTFFTIPQASVGLDREVGRDLTLHLQLDYASDAPNPVGGGNGVGLNEAYVRWTRPELEVKVGGFALPFQDLEINGPFRTTRDTITPSALTTFFESRRVVGAEFLKVAPRTLWGTEWRLGFFSGGDPALTGAAPAFGPMRNSVGLGALTGSTGGDDEPGFYLDVRNIDRPGRASTYRLAYYDSGGDPTGPTATTDTQGLIYGSVSRRGKLTSYSLTGILQSDGAPGVHTVHRFGYQSLKWDFDARDSVTLRYDKWKNKIERTGGGGSEGIAFTLAWTRRLSDNSAFQFEYLLPTEDLLANLAAIDIDDDLVQVRYSVWF